MPLGHRVAAGSMLVASAVATAAWTLYYDIAPEPLEFLIIAGVSLVPLGVVAGVRSLRRAVLPGVVIVLSVALLSFTVVVSQPDDGSDLYVYAVYGRIIADQGDSPYVHPPSDYPEDPWVQGLGLYRNSRAFYGPLFIGATGVIAAVGGDSRLGVRLAYQTGAALAVALCLLLLARTGAPAMALALVGLNPVLLVEVVGQGRMDAYLGLGLLAGAIFASRGRLHLAALALAAATLVKVPAGLALGALIIWVWYRYGLRKAASVTAIAGGAVLVAYLAAGGLDAVRPLLDASDASNDASIWVLARDFPHGLARATGDTSVLLGPPGSIATIAAIAAIAFGALFVVPRLGDRRPDLVLALPVFAYLLTSPYPSIWYFAWILPIVALRPRSLVALISLTLFPLILVEQFYDVSLHIQAGARTFADFAIPLTNPFIRFLSTGTVLIEVLGLLVLSVDAIRRLRAAPRPTFEPNRKPPQPDPDRPSGVSSDSARGAGA